jgi:hypothetical protein
LKFHGVDFNECCCIVFLPIQVMRCLDIMISSRQQEMVEAKSSGSACGAAIHSGSGCATGPLASQHLGASSGEFALTITTRAGSSRLGSLQHASPQPQLQQHGSQQSLQLHTSQSLVQHQTSQSLAQNSTQSNAVQTSQSNAAVTSQSNLQQQQQQQQQHGDVQSGARRSRLAPGAGRLGLAVDDAANDSPYGPQDL